MWFDCLRAALLRKEARALKAPQEIVSALQGCCGRRFGVQNRQNMTDNTGFKVFRGILQYLGKDLLGTPLAGSEATP